MGKSLDWYRENYKEIDFEAQLFNDVKYHIVGCYKKKSTLYQILKKEIDSCSITKYKKIS